MEFDCLFWNYCLGTVSIVLLFCVMTQFILLIRSQRKSSRIKSAAKKIKLEIESGPEELESKREELNALKIARKQGTPLPTPKGDIIENPYETIKPKENALLATRDSVGDRLKKIILNRKVRRKAVTFNSEQFEVIPDSFVQITSDGLEQRSHSMTDILEELSTEEFTRNRPCKVEPTYINMLGNKKAKAVAKVNQTTVITREKRHVYAKCQKPSPLPRGSNVIKMNHQLDETENIPKTIGNLKMAPVSSNSQDLQMEHQYNQNKTTTDDGILNTDCDDEFDEDEMYNKQLEKEMSDSKFTDRDSKPILPKKLSIKSQSGLSDVKHQIVESGHDATSLDSYDILPAPRPITTTSRSGNELVPPTPFGRRKTLYNSPSPTPSRKSNMSET